MWIFIILITFITGVSTYSMSLMIYKILNDNKYLSEILYNASPYELLNKYTPDKQFETLIMRIISRLLLYITGFPGIIFCVLIHDIYYICTEYKNKNVKEQKNPSHIIIHKTGNHFAIEDIPRTSGFIQISDDKINNEDLEFVTTSSSTDDEYTPIDDSKAWHVDSIKESEALNILVADSYLYLSLYILLAQELAKIFMLKTINLTFASIVNNSEDLLVTEPINAIGPSNENININTIFSNSIDDALFTSSYNMDKSEYPTIVVIPHSYKYDGSFKSQVINSTIKDITCNLNDINELINRIKNIVECE